MLFLFFCVKDTDSLPLSFAALSTTAPVGCFLLFFLFFLANGDHCASTESSKAVLFFFAEQKEGAFRRP